MARGLRLALLVAALTAVFADSAAATRLALPETLQTAHFQIHFDGNPPPPAKPVTHTMAGDLAGNLEQAYEHFVTTLGYPAPLDDGDGRIDVYVDDLTPQKILGQAFTDNGNPQSPGYFQLDDEQTQKPETAVHELFHLIQFAAWAPFDGYVLEGTAEWATFHFLNFPLTVDVGEPEPVPLKATLGAPDMSLTCISACGIAPYEEGGYSRWHFYQYLTERFGGQPVKELLAKARALNDPALPGSAILEAYLADKGATLSSVFNDWSVANLTGNYAAAGIKGAEPVPYSTTPTGPQTGTLAQQKVTVNHLAARYLAFQRGGGSGPCHPATLTLLVAIPAGTASRPFFYWNAPGSTPVPLAINGSTASVSVPWDTCTWEHSGYLSLPNASATLEAQVFTVDARLTVDKSKIVTSVLPPAGSYTGPTIVAPDVEEAPTLALYGPETIRVSRKKRLLRLVVFSGGSGMLDVQLGSLNLGTRELRSGSNDLRFTLPQTAMRTLANTRLLTVTALSSDGFERGESLTRKLLLTK